MNADGSGTPTNLTRNLAYDADTAVSPDGKIAFVSLRDGNFEIYTMNTDGSNQINRTNNPAWDSYPNFSYDGKQITFHSNRDGNFEVYKMNSSGTGQVNLTHSPADEGAPAFSPDGKKVTFESNRDGNAEIYTMNATDGSSQSRLTNNPAADGDPDWGTDSTAPTLYLPTDVTKEATGPNGAAVEFEATATDDVDGALPDSYISYKMDSGPVASGDIFPLGTTTVTVTATDKAGNTATDTFKVTVVDTTPPVISGMPSDMKVTATSAQGATVTYNAPTTAEDLIDGDVPVQCSPTSGSTFLLGDTIVTCTSTDKGGNRATATFKVSVVYAFGSGSGGSFGEPVRGTELNQLPAGASVPVKFGLGRDYGLNIFAAGFPTSKQIICPNGLPPDVVEETSTATKSGLTYDATSGLYTYVWKTDRAWNGTCRELNLKLADGSDHRVQFQFT